MRFQLVRWEKFSGNIFRKHEGEIVKKNKYYFDPIHGFKLINEKGGISHNGINFEKTSPFLRALLVTDGTVTKFLEAYLWEPISVEKLYQRKISVNKDIPLLDLKKGGKVLKRKVLLKGTNSGNVYTFAESFIRTDRLKESIRKDIENGRIGIGELLRDKRLETYRELLDYGRKKAGKLGKYFGIHPDSYILFRTYIIISGGKPAIMITEQFPEKKFE